MDLRLDGKVALVTGGSKGIGFGIAKAFVDSGAQVLLVSRKAEGLEKAAAELGDHASWAVGNAGRPEDAERCVATAIERFGACDILVNNAATNPYAGPLIDADVPRWDKTFEVNVRGPFVWTQAAWRAWMKEHGGCVINISSIGALKTSPILGVYDVCKSALLHMTQQLAVELAPGVRVNAIAPGVVPTDFARVLWEGERGAKVAAATPLQRIGLPSDIGAAAVYLAAGAPWMTGQTLVLDGGSTIAFTDVSFE